MADAETLTMKGPNHPKSAQAGFSRVLCILQLPHIPFAFIGRSTRSRHPFKTQLPNDPDHTPGSAGVGPESAKYRKYATL
jgi:hypothetical protein